MARHGFGKGEHRYFKYPLPDLIGGLRTALYPYLAGIANDWSARMGIERRYPDRHTEFLKQCPTEVRRVRRRCCFSMCLAISTVCIKTYSLYSEQPDAVRRTRQLSPWPVARIGAAHSRRAGSAPQPSSGARKRYQ